MTLAHFVDNRAGNTLDATVGARLDAARAAGPIQLDIAAGFFDLDGFQRLHPHLRAGETVLLLSAEPPRECGRTTRPGRSATGSCSARRWRHSTPVSPAAATPCRSTRPPAAPSGKC